MEQKRIELKVRLSQENNILSTDIETIIVRCPNWVGDIVMATPFFDCLRESFQQARLVAIVRSYAQGILRDGPWFDSFIDCSDKTWGGLRAMVGAIRKVSPDMAVVLPNSIRSVLPIRIAGVRNVYGYRRSGRGFLMSGGPRPRQQGGRIEPIPMVDYYLEIARWMGLKTQAEPSPTLYTRGSIEEEADRLLCRYGIGPDELLVGLNPGASFGSSKCWPAEYFARTAELTKKEFNSKIILFVGPGEDVIASAIESQTDTELINTSADKIDLELLKPLIRRCNLLITNDTGPRHYAVALDVPVVVIMGPTDPRYTASNLEKTIVLRQDLPCSPCHKKQCPTDQRCMRDITPEMVLQAGRELLERNSVHEA
ncbi:MAG: lipopolysaccharide heptosyltransferase II [Planctomycetota bacterium]|jgi:heptosyltransferase-2